MKIPVTIITGFLGSGKTTLITNLLKTTPDKRLAVLVNEFGEVSIDGDLLRAAGQESEGGVEIHDLPNGCICCTVQDDFMPTMLRLKERKHEIDHILIETSGLALPTPVMAALNWPEIRNDFELDAVLTVVDTPELLAGHLEVGQPIPGAEQAEEVPEHINGVAVILNEQLENADVV
ncbi:MAG: GTP-binding protein, partial [Verrucomicrobiota bacterium]